MRIAIVIPDLLPGGPANVVFAISSCLIGAGHDVAIFTLRKLSAGDHSNFLSKIGVAIFPVAADRFRHWSPWFSPLLDAVERYSPDVINVHGIRPTILSLGTCIPRVATVHSNVIEDFLLEYGRLVTHFAWPIYRFALRRQAAVISVSDSVRDFLRRERVNSVAVHNGVDSRRWRIPDDDERAKARDFFGLDSRPIISVIGRLIERKNIQAIVEAMEPLDKRLPAQLVIAGSGPLLDLLVSRVKELHLEQIDVVFLGEVRKVRDLLWCTDLMMSMSLSEGAPMSVLEAISCGVPCILSEIPPHIEIKRSGVGRVTLAKSGFPANLADAIVVELSKDVGLSQPLRDSQYDSVVASDRYVSIFSRLLK